MEYSFVDCTHYISYFPGGGDVVSAYGKIIIIIIIIKVTYDRLSPKILSFSFSSWVQHVIHTVITNSINATIHTGIQLELITDAKSGGVLGHTFTKLTASDQTDDRYMAEIQETCRAFRFSHECAISGQRETETNPW